MTGEGFTWPERVPLYPVWLAGLHVITGYSYARELYVQCFAGALAVWLTFVLAGERFGHVAGLAAALGAAIDIVLVRQSVGLLTEILFTPAVLVASPWCMSASAWRRRSPTGSAIRTPTGAIRGSSTTGRAAHGGFHGRTPLR
jgi:hypothetical protein